MTIRIQGAREHNLQGIDLEIGAGLTAVTGISGSGKTSLVFDTLYHEARRRFLDVYTLGRTTARLAPAEVDTMTGLGPAVAVGQNLLNRNPGSTLATASGLHPFLRLLYANFGERGCPRCGHFSPVLSEDEILARLVALASQAPDGPLEIYASLVRKVKGSHHTLVQLLAATFGLYALRVDGAEWDGKPLLASEQHTIEVRVGRTPQPLSGVEERLVATCRDAIRQVAQLGAQALVTRWDDQEQAMANAPVCLACGTWLETIRPALFRRSCPHCTGAGCDACSGTGLHPAAAGVRWDGLRLNEIVALTVDEARARFAAAVHGSGSARLFNEIESRLAALARVGLGYVTLDRPSPTLSRGEAQRVRIALVLLSRLEDMLHVLDEPTVGQHPADVDQLLPAFRELAGPVVFVEHDRAAVAFADRVVDLGPGAGANGGRLIYEGRPSGLWSADTPSGRYFSRRVRLQAAAPRPAPERFLTIRGASLRNLRNIDVPIPLARLTVVTGVSGSGKSTLVEDVLAASLLARAQAPERVVGCREIESNPVSGTALQVAIVDQSPIGRNPRSNPATYTKLADVIRDLFAAVTGLSASHFSFNRPEGACPVCEGLGAIEVPMRYLPGEWITCAECEGLRFSDEVLSGRVPFGDHLLSVADFYALSVSDARRLLARETRLPRGRVEAARRILEALDDIGLGYLSLGQPSPTLSGGEAQRVKLAKTLGSKSLAGQLVILDEPSTGLHPQDLAGLLAVLERLTRAGATVVVVEHDRDIMRSADWIVDLGPGSGPRGGRLLYAGPPAGLEGVEESITGRMLREDETEARRGGNGSATGVTETSEATPSSPSPLSRSLSRVEGVISIRGARAHNLRDVDVDFPKGKLTVVTGVSGSGKSSLVHDVLEAEARRRFLETLTLYERQGTREGPEAEASSVTGLGVALTVAAERLVYQRRATVGTATELSHHLAILLAEAGGRDCMQCGGPMARGIEWRCPSCGATAPIARPRHFSPSTYAAACRTCHGIGTLQVPRPEKLIVHPEKPLCSGAMYSPGFFPNGYLCQPFNHGYYLVQALATRYDFDPCTTPWDEMPAQAQQAFLFGDPEPLEVTVVGHSGRASQRTAPFPGFYGFIRDWDVGGTYTDTEPCPECHGAGLRPEYLAVKLVGHNVHQLNLLPISELAAVAGQLILPSHADRRLEGALRTLRHRLRFLEQAGLGYLHLGRVAGTLSAGEAQRIRLASLLGSGLTSLTILLDEPTRGLHPREVTALIQSLAALRDEGNTVIVVEHDPVVIRAADHLIDVGPGAGEAGGLIVAQGSPKEVARGDSLTAQWLAGKRRAGTVRERRTPKSWLTVRGARANNLVGETVRLPLGVLAGVCGVSGSGKSTLVIDTIGRALAPAKQTTSVAYEPVQPGEHEAIEGAPPRAVLLDQSRTGVHSPATFLDLSAPLRSLYAASEDARALGLDEAALATGCSACDGRGAITLDMGFLPDVHVPCEACRGTGHQPEAWQVRVHDVSLPELYGLTIDQAHALFAGHEPVSRALQSARDLGLGYLVLRQPGYALSGGEAQRLKIARELVKKIARGTLYILDEPSLGQHLEDVQRLVAVLNRLVDADASVMVVEHHPHVLAACDWLVELGPGGGPAGGRVIASGTPEDLAPGATPIAPYLREVL